MSAYRASINNDQPQSSKTSFTMSAYWTAPPMINSRAAKCPSCCQPTGQPLWCRPTGHPSWCRPTVHPSWCRPTGQHHRRSAPEQWNVLHDVGLLDSITKKISSRAAKCPSCCQPTGHPSWCWPTGYPSWCRPTGQHHQRSAPKEWNVHHVSAYRTPSPMINHRAVRRPSWCQPTGHHHQRSAPERPADPHR